MNGQEQKERNTAVAKLERAFDQLDKDARDLFQAEMEARFKADAALEDRCLTAVGEEKAARIEYVDYLDMELRREIIKCRLLCQLSFWGRLRWLFTGRID